MKTGGYMFSFFTSNIKRIGFEDLQIAIKNPTAYLLINTLSVGEQNNLIKSTIPYETEEKTINDLINSYEYNKKFVIYGKNSCDESAEKKVKQLLQLGFTDVYLYSGGLFEWMLLQDIYGFDEFPTTQKVLDILQFRQKRQF